MLPIKRAASSLYQPIPPQGQAAGAGALRPSLTRDLLEGGQWWILFAWRILSA